MRFRIKIPIAAVCLLTAVTIAHAQGAVRYDWNVQTISTTGGQPGGLYPVMAVVGAQIDVCTAPATGVPCTNHATTYQDATGSTSCPATAQLTRPGLTACVAR